MSLATWICFVGALQSSALTIFMERHDPAAWSLGLDSKLFACAYSVSKTLHIDPKGHLIVAHFPTQVTLIITSF